MRTSEVAEEFAKIFGVDLSKAYPEYREMLNEKAEKLLGRDVYTSDECMAKVRMHEGLERQRREQAETRCASLKKALDEKLYTQREELLSVIEERIPLTIKGKYRIEGALSALDLMRAYFRNEDQYL